MTDATGQVVKSRHDYLPFGEEIAAGVGGRDTSPSPGYNPGSVRQKFTGYEREAETGLDFAQARYLASGQGRFTSVDPSRVSIELTGPQSWNRYTYTLNNPLAYVDHNGKWPTRIHNQIVDPAFRGLSKAQRQIIKDGSWSVDDPKRGGFDLDKVSRHRLRRPNQSVKDAASETAVWIGIGQDEAARAAKAGNKDEALRLFGMIFHTVSDMTSPAHEGYQVWRDVTDNQAMNPAYGLGEWAVHALSESEIGFTSYRQGLAVAATLKLYKDTFGSDAQTEATGGIAFGSENDPNILDMRRSSMLGGPSGDKS